MSDERLALEGGTPVRNTLLPYGRQSIDDADIAAVVEVLRSPWLTTGPKVGEFEAALAQVAGTKHAVALNSGTAALHACMFALGIQPGDEVLVPAMTFAASANCVLYQGGMPVFVDVAERTLLIDPEDAARKITPRTKALVAVDYAGQPCAYDALRRLAEAHNLKIVADACHAIGATYDKRPVGSLADLSSFSFHPVKHITTGEGGAVTTDDPELAQRVRLFRNHGITSDHRQREAAGSWFYEMTDLGYNYRLSDMQCALGQSQLTKLPQWVARRQAIARHYDAAFASEPGLQLLETGDQRTHAYHLYVVLLLLDRLTADRRTIFQALRAEGIGVNVHYVPVHLHPYYRQRLNTQPGMCPVAEAAYERLVTLPLFPVMTDDDAADAVTAVRKVLRRYAR